MTWTKLDDNIFQHPKMVRAGEDAANLYVRALVYCNRYLTDGRIEDGVLCAITSRRDAAKLAERLVAVGAWEVHPDGGWTVHNFHEHNPTAEEVIAKRAEVAAKRAEAGKLGGKRSGESRSNEAKRKQRDAEASKQNEPNDDEATKQNGSPVPSAPLPSVEDNSPSGSAEGATAPNPPPPVVPPYGDRQTTDAAKATDTSTKGDDAKPAKRKRAKAAPTPDTIPAPGTLARRVFEAIVGDRGLCAIVVNPGDAAERWADPATYPGVDVLAEVKRAGEWMVTARKPATDGRAFLRGWLQRKADEIARAPKPSPHDPTANGHAYVAPPPPARAFVPKVVPLPPGFDAALLGGAK